MKKFILFPTALAAVGIIISSGTVYSGVISRPPITVPTLNEWGMIGTAIMLGAAAVYSIFKRK